MALHKLRIFSRHWGGIGARCWAEAAPDAMGGNAIGTNVIVTDAIKPAISKMICARDGRGRAGIDCYPLG